MTENYTRDHFRDHAQIRMPITTSTDGESFAVPVINLINQFSLVSKLVGITSYGVNNLARCKFILKSSFYNTGVFDLVKPMFVINCHAYVLSNACNVGLLDVKYDDERVDNQVTRSNI